MTLLLSIVVGVLFGTGVYMLMRRTLVQLLIGLAMISNAANLLIFTSAGLTRKTPPVVPADALVPPTPFADPVPQALILTAIVISFGVIAFTLALANRTYQEIGSENVNDMRSTDE
jgi:multicomponent Na+:H+ antiporter subunit C